MRWATGNIELGPKPGLETKRAIIHHVREDLGYLPKKNVPNVPEIDAKNQRKSE